MEDKLMVFKSLRLGGVTRWMSLKRGAISGIHVAIEMFYFYGCRYLAVDTQTYTRDKIV